MDALGALDYVVLALVLLLFLACGVYFNRRDKEDATLRNFLLANRAMAVIPVAISVVATRYSAVGMTGGTGEVYMYGVEFTIAKYASALGNIIAAFVIIPVFHGIYYVSMYEYMEKRFSRLLRLLYSGMYIIGETLSMSLVLYVPALSISTLTGIPIWVSVLVSGAVCILYSSLGGTKAVIWTDVLQTFLMCGCFLLVIIKGTIDAGGPKVVWDRAVSGERVTHFTVQETPTSRYSVWSLTMDGVVMSIATLCTKQAVVQRFLSVQGRSQAVQVTLVSAIVTAIFAILVGAAGVVVYASYYGCDPITDKSNTRVTKPDQLLVYFVSTAFSTYPGLQGLAVAGLFSGSLSTMSSFINSFAATTVQDFIKVLYPKALADEKKSVRLCQILTVVYGLICIGLTFLVPRLGGVIKMSNTIKGATVGPLFGVLILGILVKWANNMGALAGLFLGFAINLWIIIGSQTVSAKKSSLPLSTDQCPALNITGSLYGMPEFNNTFMETTTAGIGTTAAAAAAQSSNSFALYNISFMWYGPLAVLTTLVIGCLVSLITGRSQNVDPRLLSPVLTELPCCRHRENDGEEMGSYQPPKWMEYQNSRQGSEILLTFVQEPNTNQNGNSEDDDLKSSKAEERTKSQSNKEKSMTTDS